MNQNTPIPIKDVKKMLGSFKGLRYLYHRRIVAFTDKNFAVLSPDHSIQLKPEVHGLTLTAANIPWINPFDKYVWNYNIAIAKEASLLGFDEIQFDYVRFPEVQKNIIYNDFLEEMAGTKM